MTGPGTVPTTGAASTVTVAAIGARSRIQGYALAGVTLVVAEDADAVREAWRTLDRGIGFVILTPDAAEALGAELDVEWPLTAVMPG
ncbi:MAG TPA: hypothetical protein VF444_13680 [Pseudonocardiaceae bacterium]